MGQGPGQTTRSSSGHRATSVTVLLDGCPEEDDGAAAVEKLGIATDWYGAMGRLIGNWERDGRYAVAISRDRVGWLKERGAATGAQTDLTGDWLIGVAFAKVEGDGHLLSS